MRTTITSFNHLYNLYNLGTQEKVIRIIFDGSTVKIRHIPVVLDDVVEVIPPDHGGVPHLQLSNDSGQDAATDGDLEIEVGAGPTGAPPCR